MHEVWSAVGVVAQIALTIVLGILVLLLGLLVAAAAAMAAVVAFPLAGMIALIWEVGFIDALAWTWSIATAICLVPAGWGLKQLDGLIAGLIG
jgi:hypothetical protein